MVNLAPGEGSFAVPFGAGVVLGGEGCPLSIAEEALLSTKVQRDGVTAHDDGDGARIEVGYAFDSEAGHA